MGLFLESERIVSRSSHSQGAHAYWQFSYPFIGINIRTQESQNDPILNSHTDHKKMVLADYTSNK
jgi:hypothetical protein